MATQRQAARFFIDSAVEDTALGLAASPAPDLQALLTMIKDDLAPIKTWIDGIVPAPVPSLLLKYPPGSPLRIDYELRGATVALMLAGFSMSPSASCSTSAASGSWRA